MFIVIPLITFAVAACAVAVIVWRKMPALQRLEVGAEDLYKPFMGEMFPEVADAVAHIDIRAWRQESLRELEKLLRWLRLALTKVVSASDTLIHKVRQEHIQSRSIDEVVEATHEVKKQDIVALAAAAENPLSTLRQREQELIEAIAQNPRNSQLYKEIGDLYAKLKNYEDAKEAYATVLKFNPNDTVAEKKLSSVLQKLPGDDIEKK